METSSHYTSTSQFSQYSLSQMSQSAESGTSLVNAIMEALVWDNDEVEALVPDPDPNSQTLYPLGLSFPDSQGMDCFLPEDPESFNNSSMYLTSQDTEVKNNIFVSIGQTPAEDQGEMVVNTEENSDPQNPNSFWAITNQIGEAVQEWQNSHMYQFQAMSNSLNQDVEVEVDGTGTMAVEQRPPSPAHSENSKDALDAQSQSDGCSDDSDFAPDDVEIPSSESEFEEIPSPVSSVPRRSGGRRGRGGRQSNPRPPPPPKDSFRSRTNVAPYRRQTRAVKVEQRESPRAVVPYTGNPQSTYDYFNDYETTRDYGWEYSEDNDLAPVNQIVDMCLDLPEDVAFYSLVFLGDSD